MAPKKTRGTRRPPAMSRRDVRKTARRLAKNAESQDARDVAALLAASTAAQGVPAGRHEPVTWLGRQQEAARQAAADKTRGAARAAGRRGVAEARSLAHRNHTQLVPWLLGSGYYGAALLGCGAAGSGGPLLGVAIGAAAAGIYTLVAWKARLSGRCPAWFTRRLRRALIAGCVFAAAAPLLALAGPWVPVAVGMWSTVVFSARWWQHHRPGHPDKPAKASGEALSASRVADILDRWAGRIAVAGGPVPRSELAHTRDLKHGTEFAVRLDPAGRVTTDQLTTRSGQIALALGVMAGQLSFDPDRTDPGLCWMRVVDVAPDAVYGGPIILRGGKPCGDDPRGEIEPGDTVDIVVGPYQDGEGAQTVRVISGGSVQGGFLLGSKGSGKSLLLESLCIGLRRLGCVVWYFDGQGGASSQVLAETADWPIIDTATGPRRLYEGMRRAAHARQRELRGDPGLGNRYDYNPARPPIVVIVDECHGLFNRVDPDSGQTYGALLGDLDREYRKLGIAMFAASQDLDLPTFGGSDVLRSGLYAGTALVLRFMSRNHSSLLPGAGQGFSPWEIPAGGGYGLTPLGERPTALWRACVPAGAEAAQEWMRRLPAGQLDTLTEHAVGTVYRTREADAEVDTEHARQQLEQARTWTPEQWDAYFAGTPAAKADRGPDGASTRPGTVRMPWARDTGEVVTELFTARQMDILAALADGPASTDELADRYGVTVRSIRTDIQRLGDRVTKVDRGVYRAT